jgi:hypothetical protein
MNCVFQPEVKKCVYICKALTDCILIPVTGLNKPNSIKINMFMITTFLREMKQTFIKPISLYKTKTPFAGET